MNKKRSFGMLILAAAFLLLSTGSPVRAQGSQTLYQVDLLGKTDPICVGQKTILTVSYRVNQDQKETHPPDVSMTATNGTVLKVDNFGGWGAGTVDFSFTATTPGTATIVAMVNQGDGSAKTSITVLEQCKYSYSLVVTFHMKFSDNDVTFEYETVLKSEGIFGELPGEWQAYSIVKAPLITDAKVIDWKFLPEAQCNTAAAVWAHTGGSGTISADAEIGAETYNGLTVSLSNPSVKRTDSSVTRCKDDQTIPMKFTSDVVYSKDPWIKETFPPEGGSRQLVINGYKIGVETVNKDPMASAYYYAVLNVKRVK